MLKWCFAKIEIDCVTMPDFFMRHLNGKEVNGLGKI